MLHLASRSPRRRELLLQLGVAHDCIDVDIPELRGDGEAVLEYVRRVSREKAVAGLAAIRAAPGVRVLAADTEVVLDDVVFGKPVDAADAARMLAELSGRDHEVVSAVCLLDHRGVHEAVRVSAVRFRRLLAEEIQRYVDTGEWQGKAGGYAIQGRAAAFIEHLSGSYSGVMGLPLFETDRLLRQSNEALDPTAR